LTFVTFFQLRSNIGSNEGGSWAVVFDIKLSLNAEHWCSDLRGCGSWSPI